MPIPYANQVKDTSSPSGFSKICPICHEHVALIERKDFESFTGREYVEHYRIHSVKAFFARDKRSDVLGMSAPGKHVYGNDKYLIMVDLESPLNNKELYPDEIDGVGIVYRPMPRPIAL